MDFEKAEIRHIELPLTNPFETSFGKFESRNLVVLGVKRNGRWFYGESSAQHAPLYQSETTTSDLAFIEKFVVPELRRSDSVEDYYQNIQRYRGNKMAKAAGDFLFHHVKSVEQNQALKTLIGNGKKYSECGISVGLEKNPEKVVEKVKKYVDSGYTRIKLKIKPGNDVEYIKAVRNSFPEISLMADANASYTLQNASRLKRLDQFNLDMIEQPLDHNDIVNHGALSKKIDTPICLDESIKSAEDVKRAVKLDACEYVNLKPQRVGGLMESRKINQICKENGIKIWIGGLLESGIGVSYALAAASMSEVSYPADLAPSKRYFKRDVIKPEIEMVESGKIKIPQKPGLYGEVDRNYLEQVTVRKIEI